MGAEPESTNSTPSSGKPTHPQVPALRLALQPEGTAVDGPAVMEAHSHRESGIDNARSTSAAAAKATTSPSAPRGSPQPRQGAVQTFSPRRMPGLNLQALGNIAPGNSRNKEDPCGQSFGKAGEEAPVSSDDDGSSDTPTSARGCPSAVLSARLPLVKRLEHLRDSAVAAEAEVKSSLQDACEQSVRVLRYFGQPPPAFDGDLKNVVALANELQKFLQSVSQFILEVIAVWKEVERQQQQTCWRAGLGDLALSTPREWMPISARGHRARQERVGLLTLD